MSAARPGRFWLITLAAMVGVAAGLALGFWQLSRAAQRNERQAVVEARRLAPALDGEALVAAPGDAAQALWRPVQLQGRWVPEQTIYLDNRQMRGRAGFDVLTPLRLDGTAVSYTHLTLPTKRIV